MLIVTITGISLWPSHFLQENSWVVPENSYDIASKFFLSHSTRDQTVRFATSLAGE
jgi:hypothetical protein